MDDKPNGYYFNQYLLGNADGYNSGVSKSLEWRDIMADPTLTMDQKAERLDAAGFDVGAAIAAATLGFAARGGMLGASGAQFASKTIWKGNGKERIDVENPNQENAQAKFTIRTMRETSTYMIRHLTRLLVPLNPLMLFLTIRVLALRSK